MDRPNENHDETFRTIEILYISYQFHVPRQLLDLSAIHRAFLERDLHKIKQWIDSGGIVKWRENYRCSFALYLAVMTNDMKILEYLLSRGDIGVDARCPQKKTPLYLATTLRHIKCVEKLVQAGSDINMVHYFDRPILHLAVKDPDICHLLIRHGALIDAVDNMNDTALAKAVYCGCLETIYMLLYYNADIVAGSWGYTPFLIALYCRKVEVQEALFEYLYDFNAIHYGGGSMLICALRSRSPFVKDIIERGADVNCEPTKYNDSTFSVCFLKPMDSSIFKLVWEKLRYDKRTVNLFLIVDKKAPAFLSVVIESDNFEPAVEFFSKPYNYFAFVNKFVEKEFDLDQLTSLTCRLLEYGFRASSYDIYAIFSNYGYCELFRILLYMDNDFSQGWLPRMALCRLIFDVDYNLKNLAHQVHKMSKEIVLQLLEYFIYPRLIDALALQYNDDENMCATLSKLPRVPSLIELARNAARKQIWLAFKITNHCQFYTAIDHLIIPAVYKDILTFKKRMYRLNENFVQ